MCGPWDGVIGMKKESALERFLTGRPSPFEVANGEAVLQGAIVDIDDETGRARSIVRVRERLAQ
jgi:calcineurin-like phosphoesterase